MLIIRRRLPIKKKQKVFCIGLNKTGTTSLKKEMQEQGFVVGNQKKAEKLFNMWLKKDYTSIINHCKTADFFQDIPFSHPEVYIILDKAFPNSKFILTVRDTPEEWYSSVVRFHTKLWGKNDNIPTADDLRKAKYIKKGFPYRIRHSLYKLPDNDMYNKEAMINHYNRHNSSVINYFDSRRESLLVINIKEQKSYNDFCNFLNLNKIKNSFPWENKT